MSNPQLLNQATQQQPDLNDMTYYNNRSYGGIGEEEVNSTRGQNALAAVQKYDPNARYNPTYGGDGQLIGYQMQFDPSKLPGANGTGQLGGANPYNGDSGYAGGSGYMPRWSTVQDHMNLINPNAVANSANYGRITDNRNIYQKDDIFSKLGPMLPMLFATIMSGGTLSPMMGAFLKAPQILGSALSGEGFDPLQLASLGAPFIPGAGSVMPYLNAGRMIYNMTGGGR